MHPYLDKVTQDHIIEEVSGVVQVYPRILILDSTRLGSISATGQVKKRLFAGRARRSCKFMPGGGKAWDYTRVGRPHRKTHLLWMPRRHGNVGVPAIGMNKIDLLFSRVKWRPSLIVCMNRHVLAQHQDRYAGMDIPVIISWQSRWFMASQNRRRAIFFLNLDNNSFSTDITRGIGISGTVTYAALQFAFYMGANPVVLLGIDHSFVTVGPANKLVVSQGNDPNHFDSDYFGKGIRWNLPDLVESQRGYILAREAFEAGGRTILDATVGGKLKVFEKLEIAEAVRVCRR